MIAQKGKDGEFKGFRTRVFGQSEDNQLGTKLTKREYKKALKERLQREAEETRAKLKPGELEPVIDYQSFNQMALKISKKQKFKLNHRMDNVRIGFDWGWKMRHWFNSASVKKQISWLS